MIASLEPQKVIGEAKVSAAYLVKLEWDSAQLKEAQKENESLRAEVEREQKRLADCDVMVAVYREVNDRLKKADQILAALVALKNHKDTVGKDAYYKKAKEEMWDRARKYFDVQAQEADDG